MKKEERKFHSCQYREDKGFMCSLDCNEDCPLHPDYEDDYEDEDLEEAVDGVFQSGFDYGFKKGYKARRDEEIEDFEPIEWKLSDTPHTTLKTYGLSEEHHCACPCGLDCCEFNDYNLDVSDCEGCEFNLGDFEDEDLEEIEALYQAGELEPDTAKAYEMGKNYGFEQGMKELSIASEENYLEGYKDALLGEPCFIEDEEIENILEDIKERKKDYNLSYDTEFLSLVKEIQKNVCQLHKYSDNQEFKRNTYDILHLLTELTQLMVMKPVYDYWVRLEDIED